VFEDISELIILAPILLNLKGNLEMNLAARISTSANLGLLDDRTNCWEILTGNMLLIQVQSVVIGTASGFIVYLLGLLVHESRNTPDDTLLMVVCSILTASSASLILGSTMFVVVLISRRYKLNPDNITTPLAASLGDIITLGLLALLAVALNGAGKCKLL
jgi:solute carrier family 41